MDLRCDGGGCGDQRMGEMAEKAEFGFEGRDILYVVRVMTTDGGGASSTVVGEAEEFLRGRGEELTREMKIAEERI
ncbi:unnamed protein product [Brassica napus]|uniref:(rape) hypothetical protein n=1 Tax=Brassica napus TaxID=3708 RepID=A0A816P2T2_BRANA|nr:unnamed protein product [Brassica napus]